MILIGLGNKARQGKNFVANYIQEQAPQAKIYAFADELKLYCKEHHKDLSGQWGVSHMFHLLNPPKDDPIYGYTQILQWYGSDVARKENPECWVQALDRRIRAEKPDVAIIADVRFPNEAAYIKQNGGFLVEVRRMNADGSQFLDAGRDPNHPSEIALDNYEGWDFIIQVTDGDLKGLKAKSIGVWNIVKNYDYYAEHFASETARGIYREGIPGMVDISDVPISDLELVFGDGPQDPDSDGTGFKE